MLTSRGWWFLLTVLGMLALAVLMRAPNITLALIALTLGLWFAWQWLLFAIRARIVTRRLRVERELGDEHGPMSTLWAGQTYRVHVRLCLDSVLGLPYVAMTDHVPFGAEHKTGLTESAGLVTAGQPLQLSYSLYCPSAGWVRFEGVAIQLADWHGFFYWATFAHDVVCHRVLPPLAHAEGQPAMVKRHNILLPPGVHRLRRPGSGSELLDLRDYRPGDPPKTIAWKVSARRDRLITKEFESEVPVRCTLFVDISNSVRLGPPGDNALGRLVDIAATVAQVASANRDLTGLCLFDDQAAQTIRPARGARHLAQVLNVLTDTAGLAQATGQASVPTLLTLAYSFAQEVYPDMLRGDLNHMPLWMSMLWPVPTYSGQPPSLARQAYFWLFLLFAALPVLGLGVLGYYLIGSLFFGLADLITWPASLLICFFLAIGLVSVAYETVELIYRAVPLWSLLRLRRHAQWRKKLAAFLSVRYGQAPGGLARLLEDEQAFGLSVQRFLAEHHVPYALPLYDRQGQYLFAAPAKVKVLANALLRAVGKGHDNELFVLLVDLLELADSLDPLLRAVKVALARHHRVMVVCPWPPGMAVPNAASARHQAEREERSVRREKPKPSRLSKHRSRAALRSPLEGALRQATTARFHRAYHEARRTFARLGVPMICAEQDDPARLILQRLNRLRALGRKR